MLGVQMLGNEKVVVKQYPDPVPGEGEVLVRVKASGICGSEMHGFRGPKEHPFNAGHEVAGEVLDPNGSSLTRGDRVGIPAVWGCGECRWCMMGQNTYCDNRRFIAGTHAERVVAPARMCLKLPDDVSFDEGVLLSGDGLGVPYHVAKRIGTRGGDVVAVFGCGPIGLGNVLVQSFLGAQVIAFDVSDHRLALAKELGASLAANAADSNPVEAVRQATDGLLAEKCLDCSGSAETLTLALRAVGKAGTVAAIGEKGPVPISPSEDLIRRDITLMGNWYFQVCEYPAMLDLRRRGLQVAKLITHTFPLEQAQEAFSLFAKGETGKVILRPTG